MQILVAGHPLHTRSLTITVSVADDGRWRARGDVIDLRKCSFVPLVSDIQPAGIVHLMSIDAVLDPASRGLGLFQVAFCRNPARPSCGSAPNRRAYRWNALEDHSWGGCRPSPCRFCEPQHFVFEQS